MKYPQDPPYECDVIMKGGITSGVIYPRAVCELANTYRIRFVGGSSAGAIAAAGAAAAELGRATGGFEVLERLPHDITEPSAAGGSVLQQLFQPTRDARELYRVLMAGMGKSNKAVATVLALIAGFWCWALGGAVPGIVLMAVSAFGDGVARVAGVIGGLLVAVAG